MKKLRAVARRLHVESQAVAIRRRFLPAHVRADICDYELMTTLFERVLEPDNDCLDVGANEGLLLHEMVRVAPRGRHVAWEPLPSLAARLRDEFPNVEVREAALGAISGDVDFQHAIDEPGWSGFRQRPTPRSDRRQARGERHAWGARDRWPPFHPNSRAGLPAAGRHPRRGPRAPDTAGDPVRPDRSGVRKVAPYPQWFKGPELTVPKTAADFFSDDEATLLLRFAEQIGLDYGELDVVRDGEGGLIYVVDANRTPVRPKGLSDESVDAAFGPQAEAFAALISR